MRDLAREIFEKQSHYDLLHHRLRVAQIEALQAKQGSLAWHDREYLRLSREAVRRPALGYHSVDLTDLEYLSVLDAFNADPSTAGVWS